MHLLEERPEQGNRLVGLGEGGFWELWQRVEEQVEATRRQQAQTVERKRQAGGGAKKSASVVERLFVCRLYLRQHWTMQLGASHFGRKLTLVRKLYAKG